MSLIRPIIDVQRVANKIRARIADLQMVRPIWPSRKFIRFPIGFNRNHDVLKGWYLK